MKSNQRQALLKFGAIGIVSLLLLDHIIISPAIDRWKAQSDRIDTLREKVNRGRQLMERQSYIRTRWAEMQRTDLQNDVSAAENDAFKAIGRWSRDSHITFTNLTPQWRNHDEGYDTFECRVSANGDQVSLARFLYELETDPLPVALHECEITTRDAKGQQLTMTARFSFIRLGEAVASTGGSSKR